MLGTIDNRGSHFYLALYWAPALAAQSADAELRSIFAPITTALTQNEAKIVAELLGVQGKAADIGGYYKPEDGRASSALRPSQTFDGILAAL